MSLRPLRVLFVTTTYPLKKGDNIPGFVADLARTLVANHPVQIKVIAPHHAGATLNETVDGVSIERFQYAANPDEQCVAYGSGIPDNLRIHPHARKQLPRFLWAMGRAVRRNIGEYDLIHAHWIEPAFVAMLANVFRKKKPIITSVHSLKPKSSLLHARTLAKSDRVLFNSQFTKSQATAFGYRCKSEVVYQGFDPNVFFSPVRDGAENRFRAVLKIPDDGKVIVSLARMIEVKGLHVLAAAADEILTTHIGTHLVFAGDGPDRPRIERIAKASAHANRIHFTGALPRHDVARLLRESDLFINPGIIDSTGRAEGFGITTIEALATGLPVIGSNVGGIPETIADGINGLIIEPNDPASIVAAVNRILTNPELYQSMSVEARRLAVEKFAWPNLASRVYSIYQQVESERS